jgi:hypothetical protein
MFSANTFIRTVICGFMATFTMAMTAFIQGGLGLPVVDVGHIITGTFNYVHVDQPYTIIWGNVGYFMGGIMLALAWVAFFQKRVPGGWFVQGAIYGIAITLASGLVLSPLMSLAAGEWFGFFYLNTWVPALLLLAGVIMHVAYGITLMVCLKYAGVYGLEEAPASQS